MNFSRRGFLAGTGVLITDLVSASAGKPPVPPSRPVQTYHSFKPGEPWLDTAGKPIHAHGGSFIEVEGRYYWFSEARATIEWRDEWRTEEFEPA